MGWANAIASVLLLAMAAGAGDEEKLAVLAAQIAKQPDNPAPLLLRAQLHREAGDRESALADLDLAASLPGGVVPANIAAAEILQRMKQPAAALERARRVLEKEPDNVAALGLQGRALWELGKPAEAAAVRRRLLAVVGVPEPDHYRDLATALAATGPRGMKAALAVLDQGIARLGPVVSLDLPALELELKLRRWAPALQRTDRLARTTRRPDLWAARRQEILRRAGPISRRPPTRSEERSQAR